MSDPVLRKPWPFLSPLADQRANEQAPADATEEPITCGRGCSCCTQCGDWYEMNGQPFPPGRPEEAL